MKLLNTISKTQAQSILTSQGNRFLTNLVGSVYVDGGDVKHSVTTTTNLWDALQVTEKATTFVLFHWTGNGGNIDHDEVQCTIAGTVFTFRVKPVTELPADTTEVTA
jgi:hypothetical protein